MNGRAEKVAKAWSDLLDALAYDRDDPHLRESPERVGRFLSSWHRHDHSPPKLTVFPNEPRIDELIVVGGLRFYSLCAHHGVPFGGRCAIGYIPRDRILGLSKFARVVDHFAHRFQVQERLTHDIASFLEKALEPIGLGVVMRAEHLCMSLRGAERPDHMTITSDMRGAFRTSGSARAELLALVKP